MIDSPESTPADDDPLVAEEADAAAAEAARIGGPTPDYEGDESERPLAEAGEGEAEGFELAEQDLVEEAAHGDERRSPEADAFTPEVESDEARSEYGEPDEAEPRDA